MGLGEILSSRQLSPRDGRGGDRTMPLRMGLWMGQHAVAVSVWLCLEPAAVSGLLVAHDGLTGTNHLPFPQHIGGYG